MSDLDPRDDGADAVDVDDGESIDGSVSGEATESATFADTDVVEDDASDSVSDETTDPGTFADTEVEEVDADAVADADPVADAEPVADADALADVEDADADLDDELADVIDTEIHELAVERDQFKDIAQRLQADFENYRKRMSAQISAEVERATGKLAAALLPVLDAAEAAYVQHPDEVGPLLNLMLTELRKHGLESINLLDQPFDPNLADAVAHEPGEGGEPIVAEVLRSGYSWHGRTLRPAMVRTRD